MYFHWGHLNWTALKLLSLGVKQTGGPQKSVVSLMTSDLICTEFTQPWSKTDRSATEKCLHWGHLNCTEFTHPWSKTDRSTTEKCTFIGESSTADAVGQTQPHLWTLITLHCILCCAVHKRKVISELTVWGEKSSCEVDDKWKQLWGRQKLWERRQMVKAVWREKKTYEEDGQIIKTVRKETEGKTCKK